MEREASNTSSSAGTEIEIFPINGRDISYLYDNKVTPEPPTLEENGEQMNGSSGQNNLPVPYVSFCNGKQRGNYVWIRYQEGVCMG
jgi:hypothetical protein